MLPEIKENISKFILRGQYHSDINKQKLYKKLQISLVKTDINVFNTVAN